MTLWLGSKTAARHARTTAFLLFLSHKDRNNRMMRLSSMGFAGKKVDIAAVLLWSSVR